MADGPAAVAPHAVAVWVAEALVDAPRAARLLDCGRRAAPRPRCRVKPPEDVPLKHQPLCARLPDVERAQKGLPAAVAAGRAVVLSAVQHVAPVALVPPPVGK